MIQITLPELIAPELTNQVATPERILVSRGKLFCRELKILQAGRIAGGTRRGGKRCSSHPVLLVIKQKSRMVYQSQAHYKKWQVSQDTVHWFNWEKTQEKGLQFWPTRSHAITS